MKESITKETEKCVAKFRDGYKSFLCALARVEGIIHDSVTEQDIIDFCDGKAVSMTMQEFRDVHGMIDALDFALQIAESTNFNMATICKIQSLLTKYNTPVSGVLKCAIDGTVQNNVSTSSSSIVNKLLSESDIKSSIKKIFVMLLENKCFYSKNTLTALITVQVLLCQHGIGYLDLSDSVDNLTILASEIGLFSLHEISADKLWYRLLGYVVM